MPDDVGVISKGAKCNVEGCDQDGARSLNTTKVERAGLRVNSTGKKQFFVKYTTKNGKKNLKMIETLSVLDMTSFSFSFLISLHCLLYF